MLPSRVNCKCCSAAPCSSSITVAANSLKSDTSTSLIVFALRWGKACMARHSVNGTVCAGVQVCSVKAVIIHCEMVSSDNGPVRLKPYYSSAQTVQLKPYS
jgi:hypothetical protein